MVPFPTDKYDSYFGEVAHNPLGHRLRKSVLIYTNNLNRIALLDTSNIKCEIVVTSKFCNIVMPFDDLL